MQTIRTIWSLSCVATPNTAALPLRKCASGSKYRQKCCTQDTDKERTV